MNDRDKHKQFIMWLFVNDLERGLIYKDQEKLFSLEPGGWLYIIQLGDTDIYKIGISVHPEFRLKQIQSKCPIPLTLTYRAYGHDYKFAEKYLHHMFKDQRVKREWFKLSSDDLLRITNHLCNQNLTLEHISYFYEHRN